MATPAPRARARGYRQSGLRPSRSDCFPKTPMLPMTQRGRYSPTRAHRLPAALVSWRPVRYRRAHCDQTLDPAEPGPNQPGQNLALVLVSAALKGSYRRYCRKWLCFVKTPMPFTAPLSPAALSRHGPKSEKPAFGFVSHFSFNPPPSFPYDPPVAGIYISQALLHNENRQITEKLPAPPDHLVSWRASDVQNGVWTTPEKPARPAERPCPPC